MANTTGRFWIQTSCKIWSYALCKKEEYTAKIGFSPAAASPAANVTAVTAAMTNGTGLKRFHNMFPERFFDVGIAEQHDS